MYKLHKITEYGVQFLENNKSVIYCELDIQNTLSLSFDSIYSYDDVKSYIRARKK